MWNLPSSEEAFPEPLSRLTIPRLRYRFSPPLGAMIFPKFDHIPAAISLKEDPFWRLTGIPRFP